MTRFAATRSHAHGRLGLALGAWIALAGAARASFPVDVPDDRGRAIHVPGPVNRIVVAGPLLFAQIVDELGIADRVVGVAESPEIPERFRAIARVGEVGAVSVERVMALEPDLVLGAYGPSRDGLEAAGLLVYTPLPADDIAGVLRTIEQVERAVLGESRAAPELARKLTTEVTAIEARVEGKQRVRVALLYPLPGSPPLTSGAGTPEHELLVKAGAENVFADTPKYHRVSYEEILRRDPDAIIVDPSELDWTRTNEVVSSLRAVRAGRVLTVRPSTWVSTRFPDTIRRVAEWLHPDAFAAFDSPAQAQAVPAPSTPPPAAEPRP